MKKKLLLPATCCCLFIFCSCTGDDRPTKVAKQINKIPSINTENKKNDMSKISNSFAGSWYWKSEDKNSSFKIILNQVKDSIYGQYCAAYDRGNRMDCDFDTSYNIYGKITGNTVLIDFQSFYGAKNGKAVLTLNDTILAWEIQKFPKGGDCYAPEHAELTHKNKNW